MKYLVHTLLLAFSILYPSFMSAQQDDTDHEHHHHHRSEIGIANAAVYFVNEEEFAYGLHIHYVHGIGESDFSIGLGYERIFDEHKHNTLGLVFMYRPEERLSFSISPGLAFEDEESHTNFAVHLETAYEFEIRNFHIGPVLEAAFDREDVHLSLGLHLGFGF